MLLQVTCHSTHSLQFFCHQDIILKMFHCQNLLRAGFVSFFCRNRLPCQLQKQLKQPRRWVAKQTHEEVDESPHSFPCLKWIHKTVRNHSSFYFHIQNEKHEGDVLSFLNLKAVTLGPELLLISSQVSAPKANVVLVHLGYSDVQYMQ